MTPYSDGPSLFCRSPHTPPSRYSKDHKSLTPFPALHIGEKQLESIAQRPHIRVHIPLELKSLRNHFYRPALQLSMLPRLEAEEKISRVFGVDAESVHGTFRIRLRVSGKPAF